MVKALLILTLLTVSLHAAQMKFCIQVAAEKDLERLKSYFDRVRDFPHARIEKRDGVYLLRVGAEEKRENLLLMFRKIKSRFRDAYIKKCEINPSYVVFPPAQPPRNGVKEEEEDAPGHIEALDVEKVILPLRKEVESLRREISDLRENLPSASEPLPLDKFALSAGLLVGGLFLFTWFLLLLIYRKVNSSNVENASLLNDVLKLIKILNLLSRGNIIKMENGRLMVYDKKNDRWREVD